MAVIKTRNRLVNFRLTQDELDGLKMACLVKGARNVSEFARTAVMDSIEAQTESGMLVQKRLAALDTKVTEIGVTVQFLAELLKGALRKPATAAGERETAAVSRWFSIREDSKCRDEYRTR